jgi:hypothetical protein
VSRGADRRRPRTGSASVDFFSFIDDFTARKGEDAVDRKNLLRRCSRTSSTANNLKVDWDGIENPRRTKRWSMRWR